MGKVVCMKQHEVNDQTGECRRCKKQIEQPRFAKVLIKAWLDASEIYTDDELEQMINEERYRNNG